jgi:lysozyme
VYPGQVIDQDLADKFLVDDVWDFEEVVNLHVKVPLTQGQFDALVSLSYNIGESAFETSTLLRILNRGDYNSAAPEFNRWIHAGRVALAGLVRRRAAEKQRFLE